MKYKATFLALVLMLTACGTDDSQPAPEPTPISQMTLADFEDMQFFNTDRTTIASQQVCGSNIVFHLTVEGSDVYVMARKVVALETVYEASEVSVGSEILCKE